MHVLAREVQKKMHRFRVWLRRLNWWNIVALLLLLAAVTVSVLLPVLGALAVVLGLAAVVSVLLGLQT